MTLAIVEFSTVTKTFDTVEAVSNLSFSVEQNEILALVGPSGCGKTTALRLAAGFESPDAGVIQLQGRTVSAPDRFVPPEKRGVGMVFQDYALFPHLTVTQNVGFGLHNDSKAARKETIEKMLKLVGLAHLADRFPHELSGGERQRVALARALAPRPVLVLLDEPFSNLDAELRRVMREDVRAILKELKLAAIFVTHDQEEALFMGDRLAVFNQGKLEQVGRPEEIFLAPQTHFVADFMGNTDFLPGEIGPEGVQTEAGILYQTLALPEGSLVQVALRADDVEFVPDPQAEAVVDVRYFLGAQNLYRLRLPSGRVVHALRPHTDAIEPGARVRVILNPGHDLACFQDGRAVN